MGQFSLREVFLVTTIFAIAMAVNLWSHGELRDRFEASERHAQQLQRQADRLHRVLAHAKQEHDAHKESVRRWLATGELKPKPLEGGICGDFPLEPYWEILDDYVPSQRQ